MNKKRIRLLYRSFDGNPTKKERKILAAALHGDPYLQALKTQIAKQREQVATGISDEVPDRFHRELMRRLQADHVRGKPGDSLAIYLSHSFRRLAVAALILLTFLTIINLFIGEHFNRDEVIYMSQATLSEIENFSLF